MRMRLTRLAAITASAALLLAACGSDGRARPEDPGTSTPPPADDSPSVPAPGSASPDGASPDTTRNPYLGLEQSELDDKLIAAAWDNDVRTARRLIAAGADVNATDDTVQSAYLIATSEGFSSLLDLTLRHGADVDSLDSWQGTGLIRASERGHAGIVGRLLRAGIDVDHVNNLGWVGLHEALVFAKPAQARDYVDTVRVLVAGGADVTVASRKDGLTPVQLAEQHGLEAQARILRAAGNADGTGAVSDDVADRRLLAAAQDGDADAAALALRAGADLESRNDRQQTPLLLASAHDHVDVARLLVALGADPDALDHQHDTPWLVTGVTGSVDMLEALLPAGPDLTIKNRYGGLSPIPAGERGHADYIARVARTKVDLDHVNDLGWTALLEAVILGDGSAPYVEIVRTLVDAGVDTEITDRDGSTALDHARAKGHVRIARALEKAGQR
ncbi:ankyrin repeat domain-containing protein [Nocardioides alcanivorans]|uniref:ankyrin repeat domain-containing protein n=1 Tax=Nocardioides alcanivorans TaxID=2897352 RepID=UPI001F2FDD26|nr:ankyrin repeat domain-containing protein [Nocardioides alcanivorans]